MATECTDFRPHHLRPDKCKNCFGDISRHQQSAGRTTSEQQQPAKEQSHAASSSSGSANTDNLSRDELANELRKCREEREELDKSASEAKNAAENYRRQLEQLRTELAAAKETNSDLGSSVKTGKCASCTRLADELAQMTNQCRSLEDERDKNHEELELLKREMEELHDNFKEEESEQFEQLKQELDVALKNCKILQIKLTKAERQYGQLEQVKMMLEQQVEGYARRRTVLEPESQTSTQFGADCIKLSASEYDQLLRDLNDTIEREKDLQEQMKYSQEEAQMKSERLQAIECENEVLLNKVNKLTQVNAKLRSGAQGGDKSAQEMSELVQQNEQLRLALEVAQAECGRLSAKLQDTNSQLAAREASLRESEREMARLEGSKEAQGQLGGKQEDVGRRLEQVGRLELECRQLRLKLVTSERQCKQLKAQLELASATGASSGDLSPSTGISNGGGNRWRETNRQLRDQCESLRAKVAQLELQNERLVGAERNVEQSQLENSLVEKLKRQLEGTENELARAKSRLVELDLECTRASKQYKQLVQALQGGSESRPSKLSQLPAEGARDALSRQQLREAISELELELSECLSKLRAQECLLRERPEVSGDSNSVLDDNSVDAGKQAGSSRGQLVEERQLSERLRGELETAQKVGEQLLTSKRKFERELVAMEEEMDKLRQVNVELNLSLEESRKNQRSNASRLREAQVRCEKLRIELEQQRRRENDSVAVSSLEDKEPSAHRATEDPQLLARDLNELKAKNGFLVHQLELAHEEAQRQLEETKRAGEEELRRAVELAQLELRERQLAEAQQLRAELSDLKVKLANAQRAANRHEEEANGERDRSRALERDWRREKSQWQQRLEQLESQLTIERRANEFRLKEVECQVREKEREAIGVQDRLVQLERDHKRLMNRFKTLEESSEAKLKSLARELEVKRAEVAEMIGSQRASEDEHYATCKRLSNEKSTLQEALETLRRSHNEQTGELKLAREQLRLRVEQAHRERMGQQERLEQLEGQLVRAGEHEIQTRLLRNQLETLERQLESMRREQAQLKEERQRAKGKCELLERRLADYEKRELIAKTSSISFSSPGGLLLGRARSPQRRPPADGASERSAEGSRAGSPASESRMVEKLSAKISDQRHLINMLKQQASESSLELRQARWLLSAERAKWQSRLALLTGQLNECEERLLFESSLEHLLGADLREGARERLQARWTDERRASMQTIQQQQAQLELLARDLKKLNQAHELLRLHSKQVEAHNSKLSRRLIEQQQQQPLAGHQQADRIDELERAKAKLERLLRDEVRPLVQTVAKVAAALDANGQREAEEPAKGTNDEQRKSTSRPLLLTGGASKQADSPRATPAPDAKHWKLTRLLTRSTASEADQAQGRADKDREKRQVRRVKVKSSAVGLTVGERKQLGQQIERLSEQLDLLECSSESADRAQVRRGSSQLASQSQQQLQSLVQQRQRQQQRASSELAERSRPSEAEEAEEQRGGTRRRGGEGGDKRRVAGSELHSSGQSGDSRAPTRVRWLEDSDLDLREGDQGWRRPASLAGCSSADVHRRFPQASRASCSRPLHPDSDSEHSLASDFSASSASGVSGASSALFGRQPSGAESDGCVQVGGALGARKLARTARKSRGLRKTLANTLRSISRSIGQLASDSEASGAGGGPGAAGEDVREGRDAPSKHPLREIRV